MAKLRIAEIFCSLQGEGHWVGVPSIFVRVSGCNLRCVWCDTPYASWNPEGPTVEVGELLTALSSLAPKHVVLTGGEPMLFDPIVELAEGLRGQGKIITIETAGTVFREAVACDLMSISPKLRNSTPPIDSGWAERHEATRLDRAPLRALCETYSCQLKFVVDPENSPKDIEEIEELLSILPKSTPVILMPEGIDSDTLWRRARLLAPICLARNWRLSPRMHVDLYGNTRGT